MPTEHITDKAIYDRVVQEMVVEATNYVWIATADIKDMYVNKGNRMAPFLGVLSDMIEKGVSHS
jgi:hypothetical protein